MDTLLLIIACVGLVAGPFISLKRNGFDISLSEVEEIMAGLVDEGFVQRQMPSVLE